jgi:DNA-directed RNA polymerase, mitochondrial
MARYKGYKIPLSHFRAGKFAKQLHAAGSRIIATPEQAKSLDAIKDLLVVSETETPTVDESEAVKSVENLKEFMATLSDAPAKAKATSNQVDSTAFAQDLELLGDEDEEEDEWETPRAKAAKKRKANEGKAAIELKGKFVSVTDILPPLPERGSFKVESIKASQYFFS